ncbi:HAD family hydrolase [Nocardioides houyundeii]|uniref:HAD family hydrolase n=1 Tax=Nocardioides houyundeii TaxID=2045452 RepID=UPI0018F035FC|nr:HAD family phosphatase [Nocardioides houyundeii]
MSTHLTPEWDPVDLSEVTTLLCDADGTLFGSEEPAYAASADVTNRFLAALGAGRSFSAQELQEATNGKNFRATASDFARHYSVELRDSELDAWVAQERAVVTAHLRSVLAPGDGVREAIQVLDSRYRLALVSSSALSRLDACLEVTGLSRHFPSDRRFSAEDSLPQPASKPDPAVYELAGRCLGVSGRQGLAIEDSVNGTLSAVAAGFPTIGTVQFVPAGTRARRARELMEAGAFAVVSDLSELAARLSSRDEGARCPG